MISFFLFFLSSSFSSSTPSSCSSSPNVNYSSWTLWCGVKWYVPWKNSEYLWLAMHFISDIWRYVACARWWLISDCRYYFFIRLLNSNNFILNSLETIIRFEKKNLNFYYFKYFSTHNFIHIHKTLFTISK